METNIEELVCGLRDKNDKYAYECLKQLQAESENSDAVYPYLDTFAEMLNDSNSYIRTRGILLIAANSRWDILNKIDGIIDKYLEHIMDEKPITSRQCIKVLPRLAEYKPNLAGRICAALNEADPKVYKDTMQPLICKDIASALVI